MNNQKLSEMLDVKAHLAPQLIADSAVTTDRVAMGTNFRRVVFTFWTDATFVDTDCDIDIALYEATASSGGTTAALSGKTATLVAPAVAGMVKASIEVSEDELSDGYGYVYASLLGDGETQTAYATGIAICGDARELPVSNNLA